MGPYGRGRVECAGGCGRLCHEEVRYAGFCCGLCALRYFEVELKGGMTDQHGDRCDGHEAESFYASDSDGEGNEIICLCAAPEAPDIPPCRSVFSRQMLKRLKAKLGYDLPFFPEGYIKSEQQ